MHSTNKTHSAHSHSGALGLFSTMRYRVLNIGALQCDRGSFEMPSIHIDENIGWQCLIFLPRLRKWPQRPPRRIPLGLERGDRGFELGDAVKILIVLLLKLLNVFIGIWVTHFHAPVTNAFTTWYRKKYTTATTDNTNGISTGFMAAYQLLNQLVLLLGLLTLPTPFQRLTVAEPSADFGIVQTCQCGSE